MSRLKDSLAPMFCFKEGDVLGGAYTVIGILNRGSYGIVLLCHDSEKTNVAIKVLYSQSISEHKTELEILSTLPPSKYTISYKLSFYENGYLFIVLEYYPYGDLYEAIISSRLPRDTEAIRSFMLHLIDGVLFLHENGIYHRDLKPENILLSLDLDNNAILPRIGDFGLATTQKIINEVGTGSNRYMAPEQYEAPVLYSSGTYHYDASKVDIWALGICLLNVVFSKNPFKVPSDSDLIFSDYIRDPISLFDVFPKMSEDTYKVLRCALILSPEKRSLYEMRSAVENVLEWTIDSQYIEENTIEKKLSIFNCENISTIEARRSLRTPSYVVPSTYRSFFSWKKTLHSVDTTENEIGDNNENNSRFLNLPTFVFHEITQDNEEQEKMYSTSSLDSGLGTSIGSYLQSNSLEVTNLKEISKEFTDTATNIIFPTSVKGSKSHLLFGKSWADDDDSSDDELDNLSSDNHEKLVHDTTEDVDVIEALDEKDNDHYLWMLTLEDNTLCF